MAHICLCVPALTTNNNLSQANPLISHKQRFIQQECDLPPCLSLINNNRSPRWITWQNTLLCWQAWRFCKSELPLRLLIYLCNGTYYFFIQVFVWYTTYEYPKLLSSQSSIHSIRRHYAWRHIEITEGLQHKWSSGWLPHRNIRRWKPASKCPRCIWSCTIWYSL